MDLGECILLEIQSPRIVLKGLFVHVKRRKDKACDDGAMAL